MSDKKKMREERSHPAAKTEIRTSDKEGTKIYGYAAVFDSLSEDLGGFREIIGRGAFGNCLNDDVRALLNHDASRLFARTASGTLRLWQDDTGLGFEADPPDASWVSDMIELIMRRDLTQNSFGFELSPQGSDWEETDSGMVRRIRKVGRLHDISVVTFPAYPNTSVALRELDMMEGESVPDRKASDRRMGDDIRELLRLMTGLSLQSEVTARRVRNLCRVVNDRAF